MAAPRTQAGRRPRRVVARIAGVERPAQSVVVVAHWDAGGHAEPLLEGAGADDNAAGVAIALAVADRAARVTAAGCA